MSYDPDNVFARILRGDVPCVKVCETDLTLAFMDLMPQSEGHVLVVPKEPAAVLAELSDTAAAACIVAARRLSIAVTAALQPDGILIAQFNGEAAGQTIGHVHFHVIPRWHNVPLKPHAQTQAEIAQLEALAQRIRDAL